jgi:pyruvate dehydrogenase E1 component subunit alpha
MPAATPKVVPLPYQVADLEAALGPTWPDTLRAAYRWMTLGRTLDSRMLGLQRQGRIGFYGPATGQEAVSVAAGLASGKDDWILPGLREQLVALVRGHPLPTYMHHLFADDRDPARGRQMPCHPTARDVNYVSMSSVVGTQIIHAVGLGLALKQKAVPGAALAFFGDGATSANDFHSGLNFAAVLNAPVVFCCTNNQWAISVPVDRQTKVARLADKGDAYGIPGIQVDGTDFVASHVALRRAIDKAREGRGPSYLEFVLYRMTAHSSSDDPTRYQASDWMQRAVAHDPYRRLEGLLHSLGVLDKPGRQKIAEAMDREVKAAIVEAEAVGPPAVESMTSDVWASGPYLPPVETHEA